MAPEELPVPSLHADSASDNRIMGALRKVNEVGDEIPILEHPNRGYRGSATVDRVRVPVRIQEQPAPQVPRCQLTLLGNGPYDRIGNRDGGDLSSEFARTRAAGIVEVPTSLREEVYHYHSTPTVVSKEDGTRRSQLHAHRLLVDQVDAPRLRKRDGTPPQENRK